MTSRETDAAWNRTNSEGNIMTDTTQAPHLKAAAQQALTVLRGCLEHPDASDAISALQHAIAQPDATTQPVEWRYDFNGDWWHTDDEKKAKSIKADGRKIQPLFTTPQPAPAPEWVMLDEGEVNAIIMQARIDWGNATARFPSEVEIAALAIQKAFIAKQEDKPAWPKEEQPDGSINEVDPFGMLARLDAAELDSKLLDWLDRELACPLTLHDGRYLNLGDKSVRQVISEAMKGKL